MLKTSAPAAALSILSLSAVLAFAMPTPASGAVAVDAWAEVLAAHQSRGGLDYAGLAGAPEPLDRFIASIADADLSGMNEDAQTAFWINAYNAVAARFVLDDYPEISSVKDVDGFFKERRIRVTGREMTLDEIEDEALDGGGARVHFAVNCASESCPELRAEPYEALRLDSQLDDQVDRFLMNEKHGLRFDRARGDLWLSSLFKWYAGDFTGGSTVVAFFMRGGVYDWIADNAPPRVVQAIGDDEPSIKYLEYDWALNDRPGGR